MMGEYRHLAASTHTGPDLPLSTPSGLVGAESTTALSHTSCELHCKAALECVGFTVDEFKKVRFARKRARAFDQRRPCRRAGGANSQS